MAPSNGDILSEISGVSGNWTGTYTVAYEASSSDTTNATTADRFYRFKMYNVSNGTFNNASSDTSDTAYANRHSIKFFYNTGVWTDGSSSADPNYLTEGNTYATTTSVSNYPQTLYTWLSADQSINHAYDLSQHSWAAASGGGGGFLSTNPLIENAYFAKNSDSSIALGFDWENISSYKVWVDRAGTITSHELFLTGPTGQIIGYTGAGVNALTNLSEGDKVWLTEGNNDDTIVDGYGSIGNPYSHQIVVWSKDSEKVYAKCFGDVSFSGGQSSSGTGATRLRGGKTYGSYESPTQSEITHELPRGLGKYQIELWTTSNGNPVSYVDYGTSFRDSSQVSANFW